ncbi:MAG: isochorismatase family protein [Alphaproteobacteria bacterium]|nr:isochorismatase family protein [Alphaproteobacteria bacterium]
MLIDKNKACLIISCMQKEFLPTLIDSQKLIDSCSWLIDFANHIQIPVVIGNHKKLGAPIEEFLQLSKTVKSTEMVTFSCLDDKNTKTMLEATGRSQFLLVGAETHISIYQSAVAFKKAKLESFVIVDAVSARNEVDHTTAIERLRQLSIPVITKEMFFFECLRSSAYPKYIDLSIKFLDQRYLRYI